MQAIQQGKDGIYRWVYELNLYTTPTIFFLVSKIFLGIGLGIFFFIQVLVMIEDGFQLDQLLDSIVMLAAGFVGILVLVAVGYLVYALERLFPSQSFSLSYFIRNFYSSDNLLK